MKSLHKVLDIIDTVAGIGSAGIHEISSMTGFPPATTHRIVSTLIQRGYFKQDPVTRSYALSFRFLELGNQVQEQFSLVSIARPHLERLTQQTQENTNLAVRDGDCAVYMDRVQSNHMLQLYTKLGARVSLYATAVGKMFLSHLNKGELDSYLIRTKRAHHTPLTLVRKKLLVAELQQIKSKGYAVDDQEMEEGARCVAAIVLDHKREPAAAVSVSGAAMRITPDRIDALGKMVKNAAFSISKDLGYPYAAVSGKKQKKPDHSPGYLP